LNRATKTGIWAAQMQATSGKKTSRTLPFPNSTEEMQESRHLAQQR
jgi:hypothetical protein